ncbi:MAG: branched-chain amino acid ABC transporter ATP-binding protein/permease [Pseudomonadota bacterium]
MPILGNFIDIFGSYDFAARTALVLSLAAMAIYVLLNAGIFAVPQVGLMAVGAYSATILSLDAHWPFGLAVVAGAVAGMLAGLVLAALLGHLNGIYLAIATIAFSEVISAAVLNIPLTGAAQGRVGIPRETTDLWIVAAVALSALVLWRIDRSRHGLAIVAMREDTMMARHQAINPFNYRLFLFGLAGFLSGLSGGLFAHLTGTIEPGFFNFGLLTQLIAAVVIGGMIYVAGPLVGMAVIFSLPLIVVSLGEYQTLVNGAIIMLVVAFVPHGLIGFASDVFQRRKALPIGDEKASPAETSAAPDAPVRRDRSTPNEQSSPILDLSNINVQFGGIKALQDVSISCAPGELLGVIGPNGSGKTTLLNVISGVYKPTSGKGSLLGSSLNEVWGRPHLISRKGVSRTFQTIRLVDSYSVSDNVLVGLHGLDHETLATGSEGKTAKDRSAAVAQILRTYGLESLAHVKAGELSYGTRRRVEIARAVASRPRLLLLDEPTAGMNPHERREVFDMIANLLTQDLAIIIVEHDVASMGQYCDRLVVLDFGRVLASGDPATVLRQEDVINAYVGGGAKRAPAGGPRAVQA